MKYVSDILMHFVGRAHRDEPENLVEVAHKILTNGFMFTPQRVTVGAVAGNIPFDMTIDAVCFTDIPLRLSDPHVARYSTCAIGVTKSLVKNWGGNPVLYMVEPTAPVDPAARAHFRGIFAGQLQASIARLAMDHDLINKLSPEHWSAGLSPQQREAARSELFWALGSHLKPMFDLGPDVDGEDQLARRDRYYLEREWRVALTDAHKKHAALDMGLVSHNEGRFFLTIPRHEVRVVVVPNKTSGRLLRNRLCESGWSLDEVPPIIPFSETVDL